MKKLTATIFIILLCLSVCFSQETVINSENTQSENYILSKDIIEKLIIAGIAALLGFLFNYILAKRKEKREEKELSYELSIKDVITKEESPIKDNISLIYRNNTVPNLSFISCTIRNTGELVVKDEVVRFEFKNFDNNIILEDYIDPLPEPELGVVKENSLDREKFERKYKIGHLVKGKEVKFNFVVSSTNPVLKLHDFNPNGDVRFNEASINKGKSQQEIIRDFIFVNLLLLTIYPLTNSYYPSKLGLDLLWAIAFLIFNLTFAKPISTVLSEYFGRLSKKSERLNFEIEGNNNVIIDTKESGYTRLDKIIFNRPEDEIN